MSRSIFLLVSLLLLTGNAQASQNTARANKQKIAKKTKANSRSNTSRFRNRLPAEGKDSFIKWANQTGSGRKEVTRWGRTSETRLKDGSFHRKHVDSKGSVHTYFSRGRQQSKTVKHEDGSWTRRDHTQSGLIRVTSSTGPKTFRVYEVQAQTIYKFARAEAQMIANKTKERVILDFTAHGYKPMRFDPVREVKGSQGKKTMAGVKEARERKLVPL